MNIKIPKQVSFILKRLNDNRFESYIVGGCVRDSIMGREPKDWDITTSARPEEVKGIFDHTYDTGIQHGTVTVVLDGENFEVTTYRIEGKYEDFRHPDTVVFTRSLKEDLLRRDFTINAIAYHPESGFVDPFDGRGDIKKRIIRGVGDAAKRFQEDALRMLRAVRFTAQLDFQIEGETKQALAENAALISNISVERIKEELQKLLLSDHAGRLAELSESGILRYVSPPLSESLALHQCEIIRQLCLSDKDQVQRWTVFLQFMREEETEAFLRFLKFDTKTLRSIILLRKYLFCEIQNEPYALRRLASRIGVESMQMLLRLKGIREGKERPTRAEVLFSEILDRGEALSISQLAVNGNDLKSLGISQGRQMGDVLQRLLEAVLRCPESNSRETLLAIASEGCQQ